MKHFNTKLLALILALAAVFTVFAGCGNGEEKPISGAATVVIQGEETTKYAIDLKKAQMTTKNTAWDLLVYLKDTQSLHYKTETSVYGEYLAEIGELKQDEAQGKYISIYTSVEKDFATFEPIATVEYDGKTLTASGVGISSMSIERDCVIYFTVITYGQ